MQVSVFEGNRQPQTCSTSGSFARWVGTPKSVEDSIDLRLGHAHSLVGYADCHRSCTLADGHCDWLSLAELDRVGEKVSKQTFDAAAIHFDLHRALGPFDLDGGSLFFG